MQTGWIQRATGLWFVFFRGACFWGDRCGHECAVVGYERAARISGAGFRSAWGDRWPISFRQFCAGVLEQRGLDERDSEDEFAEHGIMDSAHAFSDLASETSDY